VNLGQSKQEYLPPGLLTEPDSGTNGLSRTSCLIRRQIDHSCWIVTTSFDASVRHTDVDCHSFLC